jgi:hypothetical protein
VTEAEARDLLRDCDGLGGIEAWMAGRRWQAVPGGWTVTGELQGWHFRIEVAGEELRVSASMPGALPAVWTVSART